MGPFSWKIKSIHGVVHVTSLIRPNWRSVGGLAL